MTDGQRRPLRTLALALAAAAAAVALAACSAGATARPVVGGGVVGKEMRGFLAVREPIRMVLSETLQGSTRQQYAVYTATGTLDRADGGWSATALPLGVTNTFYSQTVLETRGAVFLAPSSLPVVLPHAAWIAVTGSIGELRNTPPLPLGITPLLVADIAAGAGSYQKGHEGEILGVTEQGYTATISAAAALRILANDRTPAEYAALARLLFDDRSLLLTVYLTKSGSLGGFGYACVATKADFAVSELYYTTTSPAGEVAGAPTAGVVTLAQFNSALVAYDKRTHQKPT